MMRANCRSAVVCGLSDGEDLLGTIEDFVTKADARSVVFCLVGSLDRARLLSHIHSRNSSCHASLKNSCVEGMCQYEIAVN